MSTERYTFSPDARAPGEAAFEENEIRVIEKLGLTANDLHALLGSPPFAEGSYALLFEPAKESSAMVAKAWKNPERDAARGENEHVTLRLLRMRDFKQAPKVQGYLKKSTILFEDKVEGEHFEHTDDYALEQVAVALANLHSIQLNKYGDPLGERKQGTRFDCLLEKIAALRAEVSPFAHDTDTSPLILRLIETMEHEAQETRDAFSDTNFTLVHFDLNPGNILYSKKNQQVTIIDWEQASAGDGAMDIAKLFLKSKFTLAEKQKFLASYQNHLPLPDPHFEGRLRVYDFFVLANSLLWRMRALRDMPQHASTDNERAFYQRVRENLEQEREVAQSMLSA